MFDIQNDLLNISWKFSIVGICFHFTCGIGVYGKHLSIIGVGLGFDGKGHLLLGQQHILYDGLPLLLEILFFDLLVLLIYCPSCYC